MSQDQTATDQTQVKKSKPILCLDFDGVMHAYTSGWQGADKIPDPPVPGLFEFLEEALVHFDIHVYSTRSNTLEGRDAMRAWLWQHAVAYLVDVEHMQGEEARPLASSLVYATIQWPLDKPPALVTIDDRAIQFDGTWPSIMDLVAFKPWNKRAPKSTQEEVTSGVTMPVTEEGESGTGEK